MYNGVEFNNKQAFYWYEKAANQNDPTAQNAIGGIYYIGDGIEQNYEKAIYWYKKATEQGHK